MTDSRIAGTRALRSVFLTVMAMLVLACEWQRRVVAQGTQSIQPITWVVSQAYSPDGTKLAVGGVGGVQIINVATGTQIAKIETAATVGHGVAFSPDGKSLAIAGIAIFNGQNTGVLETWNVSNASTWTDQSCLTSETASTNSVYSVAYSPDSKTLAVGGTNGFNAILETWQGTTRHLDATLYTYAGVNSVAYSHDGSKLIVAGGNYSAGTGVELWNVATGKQIAALDSAATAFVSAAISRDGNWLAVGGLGSSGGVLELWNWPIVNGKQPFRLATAATSVVYWVGFSENSQTLLAGGDSGASGPGVLESWGVPTQQNNQPQREKEFQTAAYRVYSVACSPSPQHETQFAAGGVGVDWAGYTIGVSELWDDSTGDLIASQNVTYQRELLFDAAVNGNEEVFLYKQFPNGTWWDLQLTSGPNVDYLNSKLSPDGTTVLVTRYQKNGKGKKDIVTFPLSSPSTITVVPIKIKNKVNVALTCEDPNWSPDGERIVYKESNKDATDGISLYNGIIVEINRDGSQRKVITKDPRFHGNECSGPCYSRNDNGKRIAFWCTIPDSPRPGAPYHDQIFVVERSHEKWKATQITRSLPIIGDYWWYPAWSPSSNEIVCIHQYPYLSAELYRFNLENNTNGPIPVAPQILGVYSFFQDPSLSPAGDIAFSSGNLFAGEYTLLDLDPTLTTLTSVIPTAQIGLYGSFYISSLSLAN